MFAKLVLIILALGATFGALLVNRQQRVDAAAQISRMHFKLHRHERAASRLRAEIARAVRPDEVQRALCRTKQLRLTKTTKGNWADEYVASHDWTSQRKHSARGRHSILVALCNGVDRGRIDLDCRSRDVVEDEPVRRT